MHRDCRGPAAKGRERSQTLAFAANGNNCTLAPLQGIESLAARVQARNLPLRVCAELFGVYDCQLQAKDGPHRGAYDLRMVRLDGAGGKKDPADAESLGRAQKRPRVTRVGNTGQERDQTRAFEQVRGEAQHDRRNCNDAGGRLDIGYSRERLGIDHMHCGAGFLGARYRRMDRKSVGRDEDSLRRYAALKRFVQQCGPFKRKTGVLAPSFFR